MWSMKGVGSAMILIPGPQYVAPALRTSETKEADATVRTTCVTGVILESHTLHPANSMCMSVLHSCLTLCDPMDPSVHGILQAGILEWVAIPFSKGSSQPGD